MRIITLWQPWAAWVVLGWKTIESRLHPRFASLAGERIGIHAGQTWDKNARDLAWLYLTDEQRANSWGASPISIKALKGMLIGTVKVTEYRVLTVDDSQASLINCGNVRRYGLVLEAPVIIDPIPLKGRQGIWHYEFE